MGTKLVFKGADFSSIAIPSQSTTLQRIEVTTPPDKTTYDVGDAFDATGMVVTAHFTDDATGAASQYPVSEYTVSPQSFETAGSKTVTIGHTHRNVTKSTTVNVTVSATSRWTTAELQEFVDQFNGATTANGTYNPNNVPFVIVNDDDQEAFNTSDFEGKSIVDITMPFRCRQSSNYSPDGMTLTIYRVGIADAKNATSAVVRRAIALEQKTFTINLSSWNSAEIKTLNLGMTFGAGETLMIGNSTDTVSPLFNQSVASSTPFKRFDGKTHSRILYGSGKVSKGSTHYTQPLIYTTE